MKLIDADALKKHYAWWEDDRQKLFDSIVDSQPTVDAVPVIRCKDCKYYRDGDCWHERENDRWIYYQSIINEPNPDDYCSLAKRREE